MGILILLIKGYILHTLRTQFFEPKIRITQQNINQNEYDGTSDALPACWDLFCICSGLFALFEAAGPADLCSHLLSSRQGWNDYKDIARFNTSVDGDKSMDGKGVKNISFSSMMANRSEKTYICDAA